MAEGNNTEERGRIVLIAMDGSKHANHAFEWYVEHVHHSTDTVIMAYSVEPLFLPPTAFMAGSPAAMDLMMGDHEEHETQVLRTIDQLANTHNVKHVVKILHGDVGPAIIKAAETKNVELIIVGSRGLGTLRRTIMGSVSDYVMHHAHVPVMICKHKDEHHKITRNETAIGIEIFNSGLHIQCQSHWQ